MNKLTIVAIITAKEDSIDLVKSEFIKVIEPTRAEKGCINYDFHQDNNSPEIFLFYENWESHDLWQEHMNSSHLATLKEATEGKIESIVIHEMQEI